MAIKKLTFDRGEELDIRTKGKRLDPADVLENMQQYLESADVLIVRCGKSFYDVTACPEIFEEGEEFREEEMTSIDKKQMQRPEPPKPAYQDPAAEQKAANPLADLYHRTDKPETDVSAEKLVRKTYYLRPVDVEVLTILCHETRVEVSAMAREALERGMKSIAEEIGHENIYAEAEQNLTKTGFVGKKKSFGE